MRSRNIVASILIFIVAIVVIQFLVLKKTPSTALFMSPSGSVPTSSTSTPLTASSRGVSGSAMTSASIPGWQTYTNAKYGFSFEYPPQYISIHEFLSNGTFFVLLDTSSTQALLRASRGGISDRVAIAANLTSAELGQMFGWPLPIAPSPAYFTHTNGDLQTTFLGVAASTDGNSGFEVGTDGVSGSSEDTIFPNSDDTWLVVHADVLHMSDLADPSFRIEPYTTMLSTFHFIDLRSTSTATSTR